MTKFVFPCGPEFRVGPHIMIIGLDQKMMQTLNQDASNGEPYVNSLPDIPSCIG
jgi:hypothetical protein